MGHILAIAGKQLRLVFTDKGNVAGMFVLPLVFTLIFGTLMGGGGGSDRPTPIAVADHDGSFVSAQLIELLKNDPALTVTVAAANEAQRLLDGDKVAAIVEIPEGLQEGLTQEGLTHATLSQVDLTTSDQAPDEVTIRLIRSAEGAVTPALRWAVERATKRVAVAATTAGNGGGAPADEAWQNQYREVSAHLAVRPVEVSVETVRRENAPQQQNTDERAVGFSIMFVMMTLMSAAGVILRERKEGTWHRLLTAPVRPVQLLVGYLLGFFVTGWVQLGILMAVTRALFGVVWGDPVTILVLGSAFILCSTGLGLSVAGAVRTVEQQSAVGTLITVSTCMLAGVFWPLDIVPSLMRRLAYLIPQTWVMDAFQEVMLRGGNLPTSGPLWRCFYRSLPCSWRWA